MTECQVEESWIQVARPGYLIVWRCSSVVERWPLTGELSLACTSPAAADG